MDRERVLTVTCKNLLSAHFKQIINGFVFVYKLIVLNQQQQIYEKNCPIFSCSLFRYLSSVAISILYLFIFVNRKCTRTYNAIQLPKAIHTCIREKTHSIEWIRFVKSHTDTRTKSNWFAAHVDIQSGTLKSRQKQKQEPNEQIGNKYHCVMRRTAHVFISADRFHDIGWYFVTKEHIQ